MAKLNCWEYKKCGREPNGIHVHELGVCPVSTEHRLDSLHGGRNAGRSCWVVADSLCGGDAQGASATKHDGCESCGFYDIVQDEEHPNNNTVGTLLRLLRD